MLWAAELSLQSAAAILEIRNETTAIQEEGGSAVASFTGITFARHLCSRPATSTPPRPSSSWTARPPREVVSNLLRSDCSGAHHLSFNGHRRQPEGPGPQGERPGHPGRGAAADLRRRGAAIKLKLAAFLPSAAPTEEAPCGAQVFEEFFGLENGAVKSDKS